MFRHLAIALVFAFDFGISEGDLELQEAASYLKGCCGDELEGELREREVGCTTDEQGIDHDEAECILRLGCEEIRAGGLCRSVLTANAAGDVDTPPVEVCQ